MFPFFINFKGKELISQQIGSPILGNPDEKKEKNPSSLFMKSSTDFLAQRSSFMRTSTNLKKRLNRRYLLKLVKEF